MVGPDNTVDVARYRDEECRIGELLDCPLDNLTDLNIRNLKELLGEYRRSEGKLKDAIQRIVAGHTGAMDRP